ncbi:caspase family protein [Acinetobacter sp. WCHA29]|uniref:caspase family protein n=1 Tax=Acinetobacter sp. WCHA29 TaxID=2004649 RepID=UPI000B3BEDD4|nr:caspase family protein [Acinetobacter sp. WCHA29]
MAIMNKLKRLCYIGSFLILTGYQQEVYAVNRALIIGNSQYTHMNALTNPVHDADAINNTLKKLGFQTTVVKDAPKRKMLEAIDSFSQSIGAGDTVIFFYAGHGASINGNNYLIPTTASLPEKDIFFDEEFINLDNKIASRLSSSPAAYKIMIMDACRNNPVAQTRSTGTRALARMDISPNAAGLSILYSASKGQEAADGQTGQTNSPFTLSLLKYLNTPNLTWATLVEDVTNDVAKQTKKQQQVWQEGNPLARLVLNVQEIKPPIEPENPEITAWNQIKNSQDIDDFKKFIQRYPTGLFTSAAQALIIQLTSYPNRVENVVDSSQYVIFVEKDSPVLREKDKQLLAQIAEKLKQLPNKELLIQGHTDDTTWTRPIAERLSLAIASSVKNVLVNQYKIDASRLSSQGMAWSRPIASNETAAGRAQNNRIEIRLVDQTKINTKPRIHAVIVGADDYSSIGRNLRYSVSDAQAVYQQMKKQVGHLYNEGDLILLTSYAQTTKQSIQDTLLDMQKKVSLEDIFVFYFAGHSHYYSNADLYLIPSDIASLNENQIKKDSISTMELQNLLVKIPAKQKMVFIDGMTARDPFIAQATVDRIQRSTGASVFTPVEIAIESSTLNGGTFTYTLLQALKGDADQNKNGFVDHRELGDFVKKAYPQYIKMDGGKEGRAAISLGQQNLQFKVN